jgi:hypothetical protein
MKHKSEKWVCQECEWSEHPCTLTCTDEPFEEPPVYCPFDNGGGVEPRWFRQSPKIKERQ